MAEEIETVAVIGGAVRRLRASRGLSVVELARRSGVAKTTLSLLETGRGNPTVETLCALASVFAVPVSSLIDGARQPSTHVVRAGQGPRLAGSLVDLYLVHRIDAADGVFELYALEARPGRQDGSPHGRGVQEMVVLASGTLRLGPADDPVEIGPGDAAAYAADGRHAYEAGPDGARGALAIWYPRAA